MPRAQVPPANARMSSRRESFRKVPLILGVRRLTNPRTGIIRRSLRKARSTGSMKNMSCLNAATPIAQRIAARIAETTPIDLNPRGLPELDPKDLDTSQIDATMARLPIRILIVGCSPRSHKLKGMRKSG